MTHGGPGAFMSEPVFLSTDAKSEPNVCVEEGNLIGAPRRDGRPRATDPPNSGSGWANAMQFFEVNPYSSAEDALSEIQLLAEGAAPASRAGAKSGRDRPAAGQ